MVLNLTKLNPVFTLDEAVQAFESRKARSEVAAYLKYHLKTGTLKRITREIYATVPAGIDPDHFTPDVFLIINAVRPDSLIAHHGALELLGVAHSVWNDYSAWTQIRRKNLATGIANIRFISDPHPAWTPKNRLIGTQKVERQGRLIRVTGPERTLVEGFRRPVLVGGIEELLQSAGGFPILDLELLESILRIYDMRRIWAAVGWFLEARQQDFFVPNDFLEQCSRHKPKRPLYLVRDQQGGSLSRRWNLIIPDSMDVGVAINGN